MKNYIGFVNDHSGSMGTNGLVQAAMKDYNTNIKAVKDAATREMLDTVVSVVGVGYPGGYETTRQVIISNPHVLKPIDRWSTAGGTPLYDGIGNMIELLKNLPDAYSKDVSFLIMVTTDGEEAHSKIWNKTTLANEIKAMQDTGRWTFVFRVPRNAKHTVAGLNIPPDNIQEWDTSAKGMAESTVANTQAMDNYFSTRAAGMSSSGAFYANAANVNVAALEDITKKISMYVVKPEDQGIQIRDFILKHRMEYLKGAAFYQLTKTEPRVSHTKLVLIRDRATGKFFGGKEARSMINLPSDRNARLHPGDHKAFDLFIQSESINRKLVGGTGVAYWAELGKPFTQDEIDLFTKPATVAKPAVVVLPQVTPTNKPTKSPLVPTPRTHYFETREDARHFCNTIGKSQVLIQHDKSAPKGKRWSIQ